MQTIKVGPKGRHVKIPIGWHRVTEGITNKWDKFADTQTLLFQDVEKDDLEMSWDDYDCLIRNDDRLYPR
ncbi:MAG: hypothetical protein M0R80_13315 [Proteobacteria bacterium]|jgi:hypothetical protein|nr:hypothetical protein [Pseudomonadota bacterium]